MSLKSMFTTLLLGSLVIGLGVVEAQTNPQCSNLAALERKVNKAELEVQKAENKVINYDDRTNGKKLSYEARIGNAEDKRTEARRMYQQGCWLSGGNVTKCIDRYTRLSDKYKRFADRLRLLLQSYLTSRVAGKDRLVARVATATTKFQGLQAIYNQCTTGGGGSPA